MASISSPLDEYSTRPLKSPAAIFTIRSITCVMRGSFVSGVSGTPDMMELEILPDPFGGFLFVGKHFDRVRRWFKTEKQVGKHSTYRRCNDQGQGFHHTFD